jgi:DNA-binding CsgD family transcriptional regulator
MRAHQPAWHASGRQAAGLGCGPSLDDPIFEALLLQLHAAIDVGGFWIALQSILKQVMPHDACVLYMNDVDYSRTRKARTILATPKANKPREWLRGRREETIMSAYILSKAGLSKPGLRFCKLSDVEPDSRKLRRSEFFRRYMAPDGWYYGACSLFWEGRRLASEIAICRTQEQGEFTAQEVALLERLYPHIETTLRRLSALERNGVRRISPHGFEAANSECMQSCLTELTAAERELVRFVRAGWSNKEIAAKLNKSVRTVKTQLTSVYKKSGVRSRGRLLALMLGIVTS